MQFIGFWTVLSWGTQRPHQEGLRSWMELWMGETLGLFLFHWRNSSIWCFTHCITSRNIRKTYLKITYSLYVGRKEWFTQYLSPGFKPWVRKILWRRAWKPTPVFLPGESHGQRSLVGYSSWGHKVRHDWKTNTAQYPLTSLMGQLMAHAILKMLRGHSIWSLPQ